MVGLAIVAAAARAESAPAPVRTALVAPEPSLTLRPGAALRAAVDALEDGDADRAEALLRELAARHPIVADHADLLRMRLLVDSGRFDEAIALRGVWSHPGSPLSGDLHALLARAYVGRGEEAAARSALDLAIDATSDPERVAALRRVRAASFERSGEVRAAAEAYLRIWTTHAASAEAPDAAARLDALEPRIGEVLRDGSAWRRRGDALYVARDNEGALAAYDRALAAGGMSDPETRRALRQRAHTLFRLRRYPDAVRAFGALPQDAETRIWRARSRARAGDVPEAVRELERVGREARGNDAAYANLLAALLLEGEGEPERARALFVQVVRSGGRGSHAVGALWQLGWSAYREGRYDEAIGYFEQLESRDGDAISALRPRYWRARAQERLGREGAGDAFSALAREFPLSYYGWRARERAARAGDAAVPDAISRGDSALTPRELERPGILLEARLVPAARRELDRLFARARGLEDRLALAQLYAEMGEFHRAQRLVVDAYTEPLARGPVPDQIELWWHAWPAPFEEEMQSALANRGDLDTALVYSLMREESGYRPEVVSVSGARGLLQLMPATAERVARAEGIADFSLEDLFLPRANIRLGSAYLNDLLRRFEGRLSAAIASYNAGPEAVRRWLAEGAGDDDEWVEAIPYEQTRTYVKRVLRSRHAYRVLY